LGASACTPRAAAGPTWSGLRPWIRSSYRVSRSWRDR